MSAAQPVRVALYARVSTRDKDQDPELQLDAMRDYVRTRRWEASEYVDTAAAGDLAHRTAWARLLADVARRRVDLVMVWKLDRAFRSTLHALATLRDFEHAGVGFASQTQPELDTTSPTGRLVFTILAAVAEMERELIRDRVKEGMRHAARQGVRIGRPPVTARPGFAGRWRRVQADLVRGTVSRRQAARRLGIGTATLGRLLADAQQGTAAATLPSRVAPGADREPTPLPLPPHCGQLRARLGCRPSTRPALPAQDGGLLAQPRAGVRAVAEPVHAAAPAGASAAAKRKNQRTPSGQPSATSSAASGNSRLTAGVSPDWRVSMPSKSRKPASSPASTQPEPASSPASTQPEPASSPAASQPEPAGASLAQPSSGTRVIGEPTVMEEPDAS